MGDDLRFAQCCQLYRRGGRVSEMLGPGAATRRVSSMRRVAASDRNAERVLSAGGRRSPPTAFWNFTAACWCWRRGWSTTNLVVLDLRGVLVFRAAWERNQGLECKVSCSPEFAILVASARIARIEGRDVKVGGWGGEEVASET